MASMADLRERCAEQQAHVEQLVDEVARFRSTLNAKCVRQDALVALVGLPAARMRRDVRRYIMMFVDDVTGWLAYPQLAHANNDPLLPYEPMHYMQRSLQDDGFSARDVPRDQHRVRLVVKQGALNHQALFLQSGLAACKASMAQVDGKHALGLEMLLG